MNKSGRQVAYQAVIRSPLPGVPYLGIRVSAGRLSAIDFLGTPHVPFLAKDAGVERVVSLLQQYFSAAQLDADVPVQPEGTDFQQRVWQRLRNIPGGDDRFYNNIFVNRGLTGYDKAGLPYGELAHELGSSARAIAGACRANPIPIIIPCHRVIAVTGLGGYMGETAGEALAIKRWLLQHEGYV